MSTERGRIDISGFKTEAVEERDELSDWSDEKETQLQSRWRKVAGQILRDRLALVGGIIVLVMLFSALFSRSLTIAGVTVQPFSLTPHDPAATLVGDIHQKPTILPPDVSFEHPMGTDRLGRDVFSRVMLGARFSVTIGIIVTGISATFGVIYGGISGYFGGRVDALLMRLVDVVFAFPALVLTVVIVVMLGQGYWQLVAAFAVVGWAGYARIIRGEILKVKQNEYVLAAKALGGKDRRVLFRHVIPNSIAPVVVQATLSIGTVVIGVAALGFLGIGFTGDTAEWGTMIDAERSTIIQGGNSGTWETWWVTVFPGLMVFIFVMAMNMIGDAINDALDAQGADESATMGGG
ncbi:MAG: peptide/nickel transport system permease protein [Halovenus sp.]|jgi:peptide/nickel transport system permease protein